jgi:hypothetical protein
MKISKFVSLVLVAFVAVGLVAPQQPEAADMILEMNAGNITFSNGNTTFTPTSDGFASVTESQGIFQELGINDTVTGTVLPITWSGNGPTTHLVGGPIMNAWTAGSAHFNLTTLTDSHVPTTDEPFFFFKGSGIVSGFVDSTPISFGATIGYTAIAEGVPLPGGGFGFNLPEATTETVPEGGSALDLLAIGLIGLVAVEGLRRKIAAVQSS